MEAARRVTPPALVFTRAGCFNRRGVRMFLCYDMDEIKKIEQKIRKAVKNQGNYSKDLELCITMAAGSFRAFMLALHDVGQLSETFVSEVSREGNVRLVPHPAFRVLKDAQEMVRRSLRELGLTLGTLSTDEDDPFDRMMKDVEGVDSE